jgi:hypothetical protein
MYVFVFVYVQVRICEKWTKTKQNRQKRARDWKKVKSRSRGSKMIKESSKCYYKSSEIHKVPNLVPGQSLEEMETSVPTVSDFGKYGP